MIQGYNSNLTLTPQHLEELKVRFKKFAHRDFKLGQPEAIDFMCTSTRKVKILQAPTGSGKSLAGMCAGAHFGTCLYLCSSKQLQAQLEDDFEGEVAIMWGRQNFKCGLIPHLTAAECIHKGNKRGCHVYSDGGCEYERQKRRALASPIAVLNYHYALTELNYVGRFSGRSLIICDEADVLENIMADFVSLRFGRRQIETLRLESPARKTSKAADSIDVWTSWAEDAGRRAGNRLKMLVDELEGMDPHNEGYRQLSREVTSYENLVEKTSIFLSNLDKSWLFDFQEDNDGQTNKIEFKPTWLPAPLIHRSFFEHANHFVFMSATFPPRAVLASMYGFDLSDLDYLELPSSFPVSRRPVVMKSVADMGYKTFDDGVPKMLKAIKNICDTHHDEKGVIHTVSWKLNRLVVESGNGRMITHDASNKHEQLQYFMSTDKPLIFVSPSSTRGIDLPYDKCRFQIVAKMPFLSLGDKLVASRVYSSRIGQTWYQSDACQELVQACGRGMRFADDECVTYILDAQAVKIALQHKDLFPKYFWEAITI